MSILAQLIAAVYASTTSSGTASSDPYFQYVSLLLQGDGANGAQNNTFIDSSANALAVTRTGNVTQGSLSPFSPAGWSGQFVDGSGLSLAANAAFNFDTSDFTIEAFVYPTVAKDNNFIYGDCDSVTNNGGLIVTINAANKIVFGYYANSTALSLFTASTAAVNTGSWNHVVISRVGTTLYIGINGVNQSAACPASFSQHGSNPTIGSMGAYLIGSRQLNGYMSNFRIVKGTAVYTTASYTVPTSALTAIAGTSVLTLQNNRFKDNSTNNFTITPAGSPSVQAISPFGSAVAYSSAAHGGSMYFDGSSYLTLGGGVAAPVTIGTNDFTWECWVNPASMPGSLYFIYGVRGIGTDNTCPYLVMTSTGYVFSTDGTTILNAISTPVINAWTHVAVVRIGSGANNTKIYINGILTGQTTNTLNFSSTNGPTIGHANGATPYNFIGQISNFRTIIGTGIYSANFTPPTAPLTAIVGTQLLLNGTNSGIVDSSTKNSLTTVGSMQIDTTTKKYGAGSMKFNGTTDYLSVANTSQLQFGISDFTIEFWINANSITGTQYIYTTGFQSTLNAISVVLNGATLIYNVSSTGTTQDMVNGSVIATITPGSWYHIAIVRNGSSFKSFLNGSLISALTSTASIANSTSAELIGAGNASSSFFNGYLDDLRITKGVARYITNFTPPSAALPNFYGTLASDPYFKYVSLLLHGDGTNAAQNNTFVDSSANALTITRNGNATQGSFSPFSPTGWSGSFNGTTDYITLPVVDMLGGADFTAECWFYIAGGQGTTRQIFELGAAGSGYSLINVNIDTSNNLNIASAASAPWQVNRAIANGMMLGVWYHVAVVRSGTSMRCYCNGIPNVQDNGLAMGTPGNNNWIGTYTANQFVFNGYISNVRILKGTALYTAAFTPPVATLTAITNTSLLTLQDNRFKDNSTNNYALTLSGAPSIQAVSPFCSTTAYSAATNGGSMYFDGTGDYLRLNGSATLAFGSSDFTIEMWVYPTGAASSVIVYDSRPAAANGAYPCIPFEALVPRYYVNSAYQITGTAVPINTWTHIAIVRSTGITKLYQNGVQTGLSYTDSNVYLNDSVAPAIGTGQTNTAVYTGYISDLRVVKGTAAYTTTFAPPTAPLTAITNTQLLLSGTNGAIYDSASKNVLETVGNAQVSTSFVKYGSGSMAFDGTGDRISIPGSPRFQFPGDFTIEFWMYLASTTGTPDIISNYQSNVATDWIIMVNAGNIDWYPQSAATFIRNAAPSINVWHHMAFTRSGTACRVFIDGAVQAAGAAYSGTLGDATPTKSINLGSRFNTGTGITGYLDDVRITNGVARYTASFIPPTAAFLDK